jgi:selenocysteine lyase/cysteine desulfurase
MPEPTDEAYWRAVRAAYPRASPYLNLNKEDLDRFVEALERVVRAVG